MSMLTCYSFCRKYTFFLRALMLVGFLAFSGLACMHGLAYAEDAANEPVLEPVVEEVLQEAAKASGEAEAEEAKQAEDEAAEDAKAAEEVDPHARPESTSVSAIYLKKFDISKKRNPFTEMQEAPKETLHTDASWWDDSEEEAPKQETGEIYFNGGVGSTASFARLPIIKVTGMMQLGGRSAVTATINNGYYVLYENDRLVLNNTGKGGRSDMTKWLFIKKIHSNGMTIILDDGKEVSGKFY